jgi:hypothetical protein
MNKRNDISLKGRLLGNLRQAKTTGLISRDFPAARFVFFARGVTHGCRIA